jgi:hypothetical protein
MSEALEMFRAAYLAELQELLRLDVPVGELRQQRPGAR